ncbi:MAG: phosphotransferase [Saccharospirillum sp.]|uniref:phosphotransferase enzyme family protein n=1 Tax=Saccharospirillum sp. TaxID=2033801 RepID=UPI003298324B
MTNNNITSTVATAEEALEIIRKHYDFGDVDYCMHIKRGFNDTYLLDTGSQKFIFRMYLNGKYYVESDDAYRFELNLVKHLHMQGVPVANVVPTSCGDLLGVTELRSGQRVFALFNYAEGVLLSRGSLTINQGRQLGIAMANMHLAADSFESEYERYKLDLKYLVDEPIRLISEGEKCAEANEEIKYGLYVLEKLEPIDRYIERINSIGTDGSKFGIIHADMHLGNIHFRGNELTIFDFDHCAYGWRAYDLAISCSLPKPARVSMIEGYESRRPLTQEERDSLGDLASLRNLWDIGDILATQNLRPESA